MPLVLKPPINNLVVVTGMLRSGKSMLASIITSLDDTEILKTDYTFEQYPVLNYLGQLSDHVAIYLMRYMANFIIYNSFIGRNSNFRFSDWTSIWTSSDPSEYIKRLVEEEGDFVIDKIEENNRLNIFMFHNALWHSNIFYKAFPDLKIIHVSRHPVDIIYSWYKKGYGSDFYENIRSALTLISHSNGNVPYYVDGWEKEYNSLSEIDRIIKMNYVIRLNHSKSFQDLSIDNKNQILLINFEEMVTKPNPYLERICNFLNRNKNLYTLSVMKKERCPRKIKKIERESKFDKINQLATKPYQNLLNKMIDDYESSTNLSKFM